MDVKHNNKTKTKTNTQVLESALISKLWETRCKNLTDGLDTFPTYSSPLETDCDFDKTVNDTINKISTSTSSALDDDQLSTPFLLSDLNKVINNLPRRKASGIDNISFEHIIFTENYFRRIILDLFNLCITNETIPSKCKERLVVTLYKGGGKDKTNTNNYRAITLQPILLKVFEKLVLNRLESEEYTTRLNDQQVGFQKGMNIVMASFNLQESISFGSERSTHLFVASKDNKKAFDVVWQNGLFVKRQI